MAQLFPYVLILICPLTMGVMMWMMMRMGTAEKGAKDARLADLERQLHDLKSVDRREPERAELLP